MPNAIVGGKRKENWIRSKKFQRKKPSLRQSLYGVNAHPIAVNAHVIGACQTRILGGVGAHPIVADAHQIVADAHPIEAYFRKLNDSIA